MRMVANCKTIRGCPKSRAALSIAPIGLAEIGQVIPAVKRLNRGMFIRTPSKLFRGKLPDEIMQIITPCTASPDDGFHHHGRKHGKGSAGYRLSCLTPEPSAEHGKPEQDALFFFRQEFPRLDKDSPHRLVTGRFVTRRYPQKIHPAFDFLHDLATKQSPHPGGSQFDPQGISFDQAADANDKPDSPLYTFGVH